MTSQKTSKRKFVPKKIDDENTNFYDELYDDQKDEIFNPNYNSHGIKLEKMILISGPTASGKTSTLLEMIRRMGGTFNKIILFCQFADEPLYVKLKRDIPADCLEIYEGMQAVKPVSYFKGNEKDKLQILVIFDDMICEAMKNPKIFSEYFTFGRKYHLTVVFLTQSYFDVPKLIRKNIHYYIFKQIGSPSEMKLIMNRLVRGVNPEVFDRIYDDATREFTNFLMIDKTERDCPIRTNFCPIDPRLYKI